MSPPLVEYPQAPSILNIRGKVIQVKKKEGTSKRKEEEERREKPAAGLLGG